MKKSVSLLSGFCCGVIGSFALTLVLSGCGPGGQGTGTDNSGVEGGNHSGDMGQASSTEPSHDPATPPPAEHHDQVACEAAGFSCYNNEHQGLCPDNTPLHADLACGTGRICCETPPRPPTTGGDTPPPSGGDHPPSGGDTPPPSGDHPDSGTHEPPPTGDHPDAGGDAPDSGRR
jgi:hypothetical protein